MSQLPIVKVGKKSYFLDARLRELRNVKNPHDSIELCEGFAWQDASISEEFPNCDQCLSPQLKECCSEATHEKLTKANAENPRNPHNQDEAEGNEVLAHLTEDDNRGKRELGKT